MHISEKRTVSKSDLFANLTSILSSFYSQGIVIFTDA